MGIPTSGEQAPQFRGANVKQQLCIPARKDKRLAKLEEISSSFKGVEKTFAIQAGREIRIMVKPDDINDETMIVVAREIAEKIESELEYPGQIKVNVVRETRAVDYAK